MNANISILFYLKRVKTNNQGLTPIFQRITINSKRLDNSTGKYIDPDKWNSDTSRIRGNSEEARLLNAHLDNLKVKIFTSEKKLIASELEIPIENLKNTLHHKLNRKRMLVPIFQDHNNKIKELIGKEYAPGTLERYTTSLKHTMSDIDITKIDHAFVTDYEFWLRSVRNCSNNTAVKYIKNFNKIIKLSLANDWLDKNPFANYKAKVKEVERVYLTEDEIQTIIEKDFKTERLSLVRDIFLFFAALPV